MARVAPKDMMFATVSGCAQTAIARTGKPKPAAAKKAAVKGAKPKKKRAKAAKPAAARKSKKS
jgi:hypothetical protein